MAAASSVSDHEFLRRRRKCLQPSRWIVGITLLALVLRRATRSMSMLAATYPFPFRSMPSRSRAAGWDQVQAQQANVAAALRRERAVLLEERERLRRAAESLSEERASLRRQASAEVRAAEQRLSQEYGKVKDYKAKAEAESVSIAASLKKQREELLQERQRLTQEAEELAAAREGLLRRAESFRNGVDGEALGSPSSASTFNFIRRERAALEQERRQLQHEAQLLAEQRESHAREVQAARDKGGLNEEEKVASAWHTLQRERAEMRWERQNLEQERAALEEKSEELVEAKRNLDSREQQLNNAGVGQEAQVRAALAKEREALKRKAEEAQAKVSSAVRRQQAILNKEREKLREEAGALEEKRRFLQKQIEVMGKKVDRPSSEVLGSISNADLKAELAAAKERLARQAAEFQNFRARVDAQEKQQSSRALARVAKPLLPVLDDFSRASDFGGAEVRSALEPLRRRLIAVLESELKVRPMDPTVGAAFDPELHEAISLAPGDAPADTVLQELEEGFVTSDGEVLRPAKVVVCSGPHS